MERPARPPALIPVKAVEAVLQCFGAPEKSMNHKNSKSNGLRMGIPAWLGTAPGSHMGQHGSQSCWRGDFLHSDPRTTRAWREREIEKFITRQPPTGEKDDYDSENSWISDGLPSNSRRRRRGGGRWEVGEWREKRSAS